jgi:hypothetical protein
MMEYMYDIEAILMEAYAHGVQNEVREKAGKLLITDAYKFDPRKAYEIAFQEVLNSKTDARRILKD